MNWYKKAQFTEKLDDDLLKDILDIGGEEDHLEQKDFGEGEGEDVPLFPDDEGLRYLEDALNLPIGKILNDEERAKLIEKIVEKESKKSPNDKYMDEQRREHNKLMRMEEMEQEFQLYWAMHKKEDPTFKDFLIERGYGA